MKGRQFLKMIGAPMCIAALVVLGCSEEGSPSTTEEGGQRAQESGSVATGEEARDGNTQPTREAEETFVEDPGVTETTHPVWACGLSFGTSVESDYRRFLRWGAKGDVIVFTYQSRVVILETATGRLRTVADEPWSNASFHVDILPQGEKLVATTCGFGEESSEEAEDYGGAIRRGHDNYEIATIDLHGRVERLTTTDKFEHFPVWSPDGQRIAYVSKEQGIYRGTWGIFTMAADGSDVRKVTSGPDGPFFSPYVIGLGPPTWSPDGRTLTYVTRPLSGPMALRILYAETVDGGEVWRSRTLAEDLGIGPVSWSPDGQQLVFGRSSLEESGLYVSSPDGSEMRLLFEGPEGTRSNRPAFRVSWSPDGEEILFAVGYEFPGPTQRPDRLDSFGSEAVTDVTLHAIRPDGSGLREIALGSPIAVWEVAWSPDGAEIAVLGMSDKELFLVTLPRGASSRQDPGVRTRARVLDVRRERGSLLGWFLVAAEPQLAPAPEPGFCSAGVGVPEPAENPGLVADCEILVAVRDTLAGDAMLLWGEGPVSEWEGVTVGGSPPRVRGVDLRGLTLTGTIPPELGKLSGLRNLDLSLNVLTGKLPPELGEIVGLKQLELRGNPLYGRVPEAWGQLSSLTRLTLPWDDLAGCIPAELPDPSYPVWIPKCD